MNELARDAEIPEERHAQIPADIAADIAPQILAADLSGLVADWPVDTVALGVANPDGLLGAAGDLAWATPIASVTKLLTAYAGLVAWEEGTIDPDSPAGPDGATVRHLLAHAAGFGFDDATLLAAPGTRRIYSNVGVERFAQHLADAAGMPFADYIRLAVIEPLHMSTTSLTGSPASGAVSSVEDLLRFAQELMGPTLVSPSTLHEATTVQFPGLSGVLPGFGPQPDNAWGLGFEIRGAKSPHWTAPDDGEGKGGNSPRTFGHFGGAGTFLWVDPDKALACCCLTNRPFGDWTLPLWPALSAAVLERFARS